MELRVCVCVFFTGDNGRRENKVPTEHHEGLAKQHRTKTGQQRLDQRMVEYQSYRGSAYGVRQQSDTIEISENQRDGLSVRY